MKGHITVADNNSVRTSPVVSDVRIREALRFEIDQAINIDHRITRDVLASRSRVNIHTIDQILSQNVEKHRRVRIEDAFSLVYVLGKDSVNALLMTMRYGGAAPLDEVDELQPMQLTATALSALSTIATAAADNRFDHTERPACREAADLIIATMIPLSSAGRA